MSQFCTNRELTLPLFTPVPQGAENPDDQGEASRKPRKDAAALVFISVTKTECRAPAGEDEEVEDAPRRSQSPRIRNGSSVKEGQAGVGCVVGEGHLFVDRGKLDTGEGTIL